MSIDKDIANALGTILDKIVHDDGSEVTITKSEADRTIDLHLKLHDARDLDTIIVALRKAAWEILGGQ